MLRMFTDGAVTGNGTPKAVAGSGIIFTYEGRVIRKFNLYLPKKDYPPYQSNNTGELAGVVFGISQLSKPISIEVISDSSYVIDTMNLKRYENWERNGWYTSNLSRVSNKKYWEELIKYNRLHNVLWTHMKGHQFEREHAGENLADLDFDIRMNNIADELAVMAKKNIIVDECSDDYLDIMNSLEEFTATGDFSDKEGEMEW